ncbi:hypothetical protein D9M68_994280 [compost metagenome]
MLSGHGDDRFDQGGDAARAETGAKIPPRARLMHRRSLWWTNEDEIAHSDRTIELDDTPETKRFARSEIDPIVTEPGDRDRAEEHHCHHGQAEWDRVFAPLHPRGCNEGGGHFSDSP